MPAVSGLFCCIILACHFFVHLPPISLVDKPAGELIVTYMGLITLSTAFGGLASSDPWLIVVVIFQSLTASHMLQTNPTAPTKAPVASGTRSSWKLCAPAPSPMVQPLIRHPRPQGANGEAALGCTAHCYFLWGRSAVKGGRGRRRESRLHLGWLLAGPISTRLACHLFSIELVCFSKGPFFEFWQDDRSPWQPLVLICCAMLQPCSARCAQRDLRLRRWDRSRPRALSTSWGLAPSPHRQWRPREHARSSRLWELMIYVSGETKG